ncbi:target of SBF [Lithohypha guttulata]|uniref:target of SBF n=1 Tax=Lithohypha guttulata TaxID=1690604 RepID=UPI002DDDC822|nr:target of SBF [Lithohypha guttulata]
MSASEPALVEIFEDPEPAEQETTNKSRVPAESAPGTTVLSQHSFDSKSSELSSSQDFSDNDEENDPIIFSFGPGGANLLPRMAAVNAGTSPIRPSTKAPRLPHSEPLKPISSPLQAQSRFADFDIRSHVINQLAFSRLSSLPISTIISHLPHDVQSISTDELKQIIQDTPCVGEVAREGKDAAGKVLENEFYYIPDEDDDLNRKQAVVNDLRKPGLRACRRQHKQYYWKKPK